MKVKKEYLENDKNIMYLRYGCDYALEKILK